MDYIKLAESVFERTKYIPFNIDIINLAENMAFLNEIGLSKLNKRLVESGRKVWDIIVEHNFACDLARYHTKETLIDYEPDEDFTGSAIKCPPDYRVFIDGITFLLQMKNLSESKRENRQEKAIGKIKEKLMDVKLNKFYWIDYDSEFCESDINTFSDFIREKAPYSNEHEEFEFESPKGQVRMRVSFWTPKNKVFPHLTLGGSADINCVNTTGEDSTQIKNSLIKASKAFMWNTDESKINLVILEANNHENIDICEAVFGQEVFVHGKDGHRSWYRDNDGFFNKQEYADKVAGAIAIRRKDRNSPICSYNKTLFVNDKFKHMLYSIQKVVDIQKIIRFNELID